MLATLRQRNFALLWFGGLISVIGDWMLLIGLPLYVYQITGSTLSTSITFIVQTMPRVLLGSIAGVFADRWDRKRMMVMNNLLQALVLLPLFAVQSIEQLWIVYAVGFAAAVAGTFFGPAESSLLPQLVSKEYLMSANSLNALNNNLGRLIGPPLGGAVVAYLGLSGAAFLDAASFIVAGGMIALINAPPGSARAAPETGAESAVSVGIGVWREWLEGWELVRRDRLVVGTFSVTVISALAEGIMSPLWPVFVFDVLHKGALEYGWLSPMQGIGGIAGSFVLARVGKGVGLRRLIVLSAGALGAAFLVIGVNP